MEGTFTVDEIVFELLRVNHHHSPKLTEMWLAAQPASPAPEMEDESREES